MLEWDDVYICRVLNISRNMLFCHKSRILKSLRFLYFDWENVERKELDKIKDKNYNEQTIEFLRIAAKARIGMWREAKKDFEILFKKVNNKPYKTVNDKLLLAKTCRALVTYYYSKQNKAKFNYYYNNSKSLCEYLISNPKIKKSRKLYLQASLLNNYCKIQGSFFKLKSSSNHNKISKTFDKICSIHRQRKDKAKHITALLDTGILYGTQKNYKEADKRLTEGMKLAKKYSFNIEWRVLKMYHLIMRVRCGELNPQDATQEIISYYHELKKYNPRGYLTERALSACCEIMSFQDDKNLLFKFLYEYICSYILRYGYNGSLRTLYYIKFEYYQKELKKFRLEKHDSKKIPVLFDTESVYLKKLLNTSNEVLQNFHIMSNTRMKNIHFKWEALIGILETEFWKGKELNFEYANYIAGAMDRLKKSWGNILREDSVRYPALRLCIDIIEDSKHLSKSKLLNKYEYKFKELSGSIAEVKEESIVDLYSIFSYTAHLIGYKELKNIAGNIYLSSAKKYPGKFKPVLNELNQRKNKAKKMRKHNPMNPEILIYKAA